MEWILIASIILNLVALYKWFEYRCGFMGAFCIYQKHYGTLPDSKLEYLMKKAVDFGVKQTINDLF